MPIVEANFSEDLREQFISELTKLGAALPVGKTDVRSAGVAYFNVLRRLIPRRPRTVHKSKELQEHALTQEQGTRLEAIVNEIEAGSDLTQRLSKSVFDRPLYNDGQQNDWDVRHLHVGPIENAHGAELLFVSVTDDAMYLVEWGEHGVQSFANQRMLEILHTNWPEVVAHFRAPGVEPGSLDPADLTPEERDRLRRRFTICTQVSDGTIYLPAAGGVVGDGTATDIVIAVNRHRELAHEVEQWARSKAGEIRDGIVRATGNRLATLKFRYSFDPSRQDVQIRELQSGFTIRPTR